MTLPLFDIYSVALLSCLIIVTLLRKSFWPFSNYPMFSTYIALSEVGVYKIAWVDNAGNENWWNTSYQHWQQHFPKKIYRSWTADAISYEEKKALTMSLLKLGGLQQHEVESIVIYKKQQLAVSAKPSLKQVLKIRVMELRE